MSETHPKQSNVHPMLDRRGFNTTAEAWEHSRKIAGRYTCWACGSAINSTPRVKERTDGGYGVYHQSCRS